MDSIFSSLLDLFTATLLLSGRINPARHNRTYKKQQRDGRIRQSAILTVRLLYDFNYTRIRFEEVGKASHERLK